MSDYADNGTVDRLYHYQPFDAAAGSLYEEHLTADTQRPEFGAKALDYLVGLCDQPEVQLVILTGNAGHGKTHLCRRLLEHRGANPTDSMGMMERDEIGSDRHLGRDDQRPLRIIKDLSELPEAVDAPAILRDLIADRSSIGVVCANEGRLRDVASRDGEHLGSLLDALDATLERGQTSTDGAMHVVNLNFQSVTPRDRDGFLDFALDYWTRDGRKWTACTTCAAALECPILSNRNRLSLGSQGEEEARAIRAALRQLTRIAEQTGYVMTFRETLVFVAFILTGALSCSDVHDLHRRGADLSAFLFEASLFERRLESAQEEQLGILARFRRLDPGRASLRTVDQKLHQRLEERGVFGDDAIVSSSAPATTRKELARERSEHQQVVRQARRRDFFVGPSHQSAGERERARRLGFHHYAEFEALFQGTPDMTTMVDILEQVVAGLHAIQGVRTATRNVLYLVDPAFAREGSRAAVIAKSILVDQLTLESESNYWRRLAGDTTPSVIEASDWLDRHVVLVFQEQEDTKVLISLDLLQFEFVIQASRGVVFETFHAADRRRLLGRLAVHAENVAEAAQGIRIVEGDAIKEIWVHHRVGRITVGSPS